MTKTERTPIEDIFYKANKIVVILEHKHSVELSQSSKWAAIKLAKEIQFTASEIDANKANP